MAAKFAEQKAEEYEVIPIYEDTEKSFQEAMEEILRIIIKQA